MVMSKKLKTVESPLLSPPKVKETKHIVLMAAATTVRTIVAQTDAWAVKAKLPIDTNRGKTTRQRVAGDEPTGTVALAINPPTALYDSLSTVASIHDTNQHEVLAWCVNRGVKSVTPAALMQAFPGRKPSFSLAGVLALKFGLDAIKEFTPSAKAIDGSVVGGRVNGGKWPKRKKNAEASAPRHT